MKERKQRKFGSGGPWWCMKAAFSLRGYDGIAKAVKPVGFNIELLVILCKKKSYYDND